MENRANNDGELVNKAFRVILLAIEDVVGKRGTEAILHQAGLSRYINNYPASNTERGGHRLRYMSQINRALFDVYGRRGARAILSRAGRGRARNAIEENSVLASATKLAARLMPRRMKVKLMLDTAAREYSEQLGTRIRITEKDECFFWEDPNCGNCVDWQSEQPVCFTTVGFIHGLVAWILEVEDFKVEEVTCRAKGDPVCRYRIDLNP